MCMETVSDDNYSGIKFYTIPGASLYECAISERDAASVIVRKKIKGRCGAPFYLKPYTKKEKNNEKFLVYKIKLDDSSKYTYRRVSALHKYILESDATKCDEEILLDFQKQILKTITSADIDALSLKEKVSCLNTIARIIKNIKHPQDAGEGDDVARLFNLQTIGGGE